MVTSPTIIALIPARAGSKRIPGKNFRDLKGHPLIDYTIAAAKQSGIFDLIAISTDDVKQFIGRDVPMVVERPSLYARDNSPDIEWVDDFFNICPIKADAFAILRPTSPFRSADTIARAWAEFQGKQPCDSIRGMEPRKQSPWKMWKQVSWDEILVPFSDDLYKAGYPRTSRFPGHVVPMHSTPTQIHPPLLIQNASLEMSWTRNVKEGGTISGTVVKPFFTRGYEGFDINTEDDWILAEALIQRGLATLPEVK